MIIKKEINIPSYGGYLIVMITDEKVLVKDHYDDLGAENEIDFGHTIKVNTKKKGKPLRAYLTAFKTNNEYAKITNGVIAHEAFHAVDTILSYAGCELTNESSEAYAYLIQWITKQIYKVFSDNNVSIHINM